MTGAAPVDPARVHAITRPDPALMKVYALRALYRALAILAAVAFIIARISGGKGVEELIRLIPSAEWPLAAAALYAFFYLVTVAYLYAQYRTLRYRFDADGVTRSWGVLFRRETFLAYGRIQDAQKAQGVLERALGIGTVTIESAGATKPESIEGLRDYELVRDFLYEKMRGGLSAAPAKTLVPGAPVAHYDLVLLASIRDEVRALRGAVERRT